MVDIHFNCPQCGGPLTTESDLAGTAVSCPHCSVEITIPSTGQSYKKCPFCAESILQDATKCRFCKSDILPPPLPPRARNGFSLKFLQFNDAQFKLLWFGLIVTSLCGVFQLVCDDYWRWRWDHDGNLKNFFNTHWQIVPIFKGLEGGTVPFLLRVATATLIGIVLLHTRIALNSAQKLILAMGITAGFLLSLFQFEYSGSQYYPNWGVYGAYTSADLTITPVFSTAFRVEGNTILLIVLAAVLTTALLFTFRSKDGSHFGR